MNRAYRHIWSAARGAYIIAPETARGQGKASRTITAPAVLTVLASLALGLPGSVSAQVKPATTVVPVGGKAQAYLSANGVPVVNINTANSAGVSHNQFTRYDVDAKGLVLNNSSFSDAAMRQSQLAGQVIGNFNLATAATLIVNEVVANKRSTLAGYTEVLGGRADVVVANPYGITCTGCGFINTDRVTLSTGAPVWAANGSLAGLNVSGGDILVNGGGLDASAQQILDLVTRSVRIDGQINTAIGGTLGVTTGLNQWSYGSRSVIGAQAGTDAAPSYAIDSSALGGMYAGRIRLIATEAGVGVRMLGDAAAGVDDFRLDAAGKVLVQSRVSAARDLRVAQTGAAQLEVSGAGASLSAQHDLTLAADGGMTLNEGLLKAGANLALQAASLSDTSGTSASRSAGANLDLAVSGAAALDGSSWGAGGHLKLDAATLALGSAGTTLYSGATAASADRALTLSTNGDLSLGKAKLTSTADLSLSTLQGALHAGAAVEMTAAGDLTLTAKNGVDHAGSMLAGKNLSLRAADGATVLQVTNAGLMQAQAGLALGQAGQPVLLANAASGRLLADNITLNATSLDNSGTVQATNGLDLIVADSINNQKGAMLLSTAAGRTLTLKATRLNNAGRLQSAGALDAVLADTISNSGEMLTTAAKEGGSDGSLTLKSVSLDNSGMIVAAGTGNISTAAGLDNSKRIEAGTLVIDAGKALRNQGADSVLLAQTTLTTHSASVDNGGTVQAGSKLALDATGALNNTGVLQTRDAGGALALHSASIKNSGIVQAAGSADLASSAGALENGGTIQATSGLDLTASDSISNQKGGMVLNTAAGRAVNLRSASLSNAGQLQSAGSLSAAVAGAIVNAGDMLTTSAQNGGSDGSLTLTSSSLDNSGMIAAAGAGTISTKEGLDNSKRIQAAALAIDAGTVLRNQGADSLLLAQTTLTTHSDSFDNKGGTVQAGSMLAVDAAGALTNSGAIQTGDTGGLLSLRGASITNSGKVQAADGASLISHTGGLDNSGKVLAGTDLDIAAATAIENHGDGVLLAQSALSTRSASFDNSGTVQAGDDLTVAATWALSNSGALQTRNAGSALSLRGASIENAGTVQSAGAADLTSSVSVLDNTGDVLAVGHLDLVANTALRNHSAGQLLAKSVLTAYSASFDNSSVVEAGNSLSVAATGALRNSGQLQTRNGAALLSLQGASISNTGIVQASGAADLASSTAALENSGQITADGNLSLAAATALNNNGVGSVMLTQAGLTARSASFDNYGTVQAGSGMAITVTGTLNNNAVLQTRDAGATLSLHSATLVNAGALQSAGAATVVTSVGAIDNSGQMLAGGDLNLAVATALHNQGAASKIVGQQSVSITGNAGFTIDNEGRVQAADGLTLGSASRPVMSLYNGDGATLFGTTLQLTSAGLLNQGRIQALGAGTLTASSLTNQGSTAVILLGLDDSAGNIEISGALHNEGAIHAGGNLGIHAAEISNTGTAGISSLHDLALHTSSGGISNAGALYANGTLSATAPGQYIVNTASGTLDANDIALSAATFDNYNTVIAGHDTSITTTTAFNNLPTGGVPNVVIASTLYDGVTTPFDTGEVNCNIFGAACDHLWVRAQNFTRTEGLDGTVPVQKGQIIAGSTINLNYGVTGVNTASLISAPNINISGSGSFTNTDLHLDRINYARRWRVYKTNSTFGSLNYDYRYPTTDGQFGCNDGGCFGGGAGSEAGAADSSYALETGRTTIQVWSAGIYATNLSFQGGSLKNLGSPYTRDTNATSVAGAGAAGVTPLSGANVATLPGASIASLPGVSVAPLLGAAVAALTGARVTPVAGAGAASVAAANGISFTGLNLALPTNPNGYFVTAKNPAANYLVETNPLFAVGSKSVGSDYLSTLLGINPDKQQKRLGDANYEAKLIRDQLVAQTGNNIIKGQKNEAAQVQALMDNAGSQAGKLGLVFGQPLSSEQAAALTEDMVWMVEQVVNGQKVLAPVVYLAKNTRDAIESGGPVIAATNATIKAGSLENKGGVIAGDKLAITTEGDLRNTGGKIKGADVAIKAGGSIINETVAQTQGGKDFARTVIGAAGSIESTGNLSLDAARDISVKGASIKAGGDASLAAGGNVTFDTIQDKSADATFKGSEGLWGLSKQSEASSTSTVTNIGSSLETGGNLKIKSGGDTTIAGSSVKVGANLDLDAAGDVNIVSRQDTVETSKSSTRSGLGVGGGLYGTSSTTTDAFKGRNVASALEVGGNASLSTDKALTLQGSRLKVGGDAAIKADDVQVLAGQDVDRTATATTTTSFLKLSSGGSSSAGAGAGTGANATARKDSKDKAAGGAAAGAAASAGATGSVGLTLAETTTTSTLDLKSRAVGSEIEIGKNLSVDAKKNIVLEGAKVNAGGDVALQAKDVKVLAAQDIAISTSKTSTTSIGLYVDSDNQAEAGASAKAGAMTGAKAGASASSDTTIDLVRTSTTDTNSLDIHNKGSVINAGGKLKVAADEQLTVQGSDLAGEKGVSVKARDMAFLAADDVSTSSTSTTRTSAGLYVSGGAKAEAGASAGSGLAGAQGGVQMGAGGSAGASAEAKVGAGWQAKTTSEKSSEGTTTARVSTIRSGSGDIERTAQNSIVDVGTAIDAAGDFSQSATTIDSRAAKNTSFSSAQSETNSLKMGVYAQANAGAGSGASGEPPPASGAGADASAGIEAQYSNEQSKSRSDSSQAVVSTIKTGGKISSTSSGKTSFEGTQINGAGGVELAAREIDFKAARNTESTSESGLSVNAAANIGINLGSSGAVDGGASGGFAKDQSGSSSSTAVTGSVQSGGKLTVKTEGDARFQGTNIGAVGDATVSAGGTLAFDAARNQSSSSSNSSNAQVSVAVSKGGGESEAGIAASGGFAQATASSSDAVTGKITSGGNLTLAAGQDARFEGTQIQAGGKAQVAAGGKVDFSAAQSSSSSESISASASLSMSASSGGGDKGAKGSKAKSAGGMGVEAGYQKDSTSQSVATTIQGGGGVQVSSGVSAAGIKAIDSPRSVLAAPVGAEPAVAMRALATPAVAQVAARPQAAPVTEVKAAPAKPVAVKAQPVVKKAAATPAKPVLKKAVPKQVKPVEGSAKPAAAPGA